MNDRLRHIIDSRPDGMSLAQPFYLDPELYRLELDRIWRRGWLFAAHSCELPNAGDYVTLEVDSDSLIVVRGDDGDVRAFYNLCRHRGTRLLCDDAGHVGRIVCPYHQWTYARDGRLASCRGMQNEIDRADWGLHHCHAAEVDGLVFVSLAETPLDFSPAAEVLSPLMRPQGLARAKVARAIDYTIDANWKIVWENNRECYHCDSNHPQYVKANFDRYYAADGEYGIEQRLAAAVERNSANLASSGLSITHQQSGIAQFPDPEGKYWYSINRTPLVEGYVSESMDGRQVAPLMGDYQTADVGTLRIRTLPNFWNHSSCDHSVTTRLLPGGIGQTRARVTWLVDEDAKEGRDYQLAALLPFWQLTTEQDWDLCAEVQRGVRSSRYVPGPLSPSQEYNVEAFLRWYLQRLLD
jgi:Rieske 2Fe-2S family protein